MRNNSKAAAKRTQVVYSEPRKKLVGTKTKACKSGEVITVNVYRNNHNAKPIKEIVHPIIVGDAINKPFNCFNRFKLRKNTSYR